MGTSQPADVALAGIYGLTSVWIGLVAEAGNPSVSVVQAGDDQHLGQELRCVLCEERPAPTDVVQSKSAGSSQGSDVGGAVTQ